jgi:hypothetical protein
VQNHPTPTPPARQSSYTAAEHEAQALAMFLIDLRRLDAHELCVDAL